MSSTDLLTTSTAPPAATTSTDINLPINLFTRNAQHTIPASTYLLPSSWRRFQLSSLINKVLGPDQPIPFDFIIDGELLRGSLESFVKQRRGGDLESTLNVEYVESLMPPKEQGTFPQDDWVSGVSIARPGHILLSSYLSHLKIIPLTQSTVPDVPPPSITLPLPTSLGATCASWLTPSPSHSSYAPENDILVGAGGMDRQVHVFSLPGDSLQRMLDPEQEVKGEEIMTLHLHSGPISSIAPSPDHSKLLSASWDGLLGLFALPTKDSPLEKIHDINQEPTNYLTNQDRRLGKKRKVEKTSTENGLAQAGSGGWRKRPDLVLRGHEGRIGGAIWDTVVTGTDAWSAGWDGSVRGWDTYEGRQKVLKQGPQERAALCIAQMAGSGTLVTGHMDRVVSLWDIRESTSVVSLTLPTQASTPSISTHPSSPFTLCTASYTGVLQLFDIRSPKQALFTVKKQPRKDNKIVGGGTGERLLSVDWDGEVMVAGGEDGQVGVWSARGE